MYRYSDRPRLCCPEGEAELVLLQGADGDEEREGEGCRDGKCCLPFSPLPFPPSSFPSLTWSAYWACPAGVKLIFIVLWKSIFLFSK